MTAADHGDRPLLVRGARLIGDEGPSSILIDGGTIRALGGDADEASPAGARVLEADGLTASPGFIDLQVNGAVGSDLTADPDSLAAVAEALPRYGVTAFLPTIVSAPSEVYAAALASLARNRVAAAPSSRGATPLGLHLEGPFLSPDRPGVHDLLALRLPDVAAAGTWSPAQGVRLVTIAPELPGALELIADLTARGVVVSAGHTAASYEIGRLAIEAGVRYATHLFNAMPPLGHREPGIAAALLADARVTIGLIPDGLHVAPPVVDLVLRMVGAGRLSAVTDAIAALGMPPGRYRLGGAEVLVDGSAAMLGGRLAGSIIGLDTAVRNIVAFTVASAAEAIGTVTSVPARLLGLVERGRLGRDTVGDVTLLTPDLEVAATIVAGRVVHVVEALTGWA